MPAAIWPAVGGMFADLMDEQQHDAGDRDQRAPRETPARPLAEQRPAEQDRRDQQQREHGRDDARGDVPLGEIDGVEVHAELGEAEEQRGEQAVAAERRLRPSTPRPAPSPPPRSRSDRPPTIAAGPSPSWPRITIQVEPQIAVKMMNGIDDRARRLRLQLTSASRAASLA